LFDVFKILHFYSKKEAKDIITDLENNKLEVNNKREKIDNKIKDLYEIYQELNLESQASSMILNLKKVQKHSIKKTELENVEKKIQELKIILNKEIEINSKMKLENQEIILTEKQVFEDLEENIRLYKEISSMDIEKTEDGFLKIIFSNLNEQNIDAYVKLEIKNNAYKIIEIFPKIDYRHLQELLKANFNFTNFLANIAQNFIQYFESKL